MIRPLLLAALLAASASTALASPSTNPQSAPKGKYKADPRHTSILFCIRHLGLSDYCGRFTLAAGEISFNGAQPEKSSGTFEIDVASIDTPSDKLDDELRNSFFEAQRFPKATFAVNAITVTGKNEGDIRGTLTLHGVSKPVTLKTTFNGGLSHPIANAYALGFSASATLAVSDFNFPDVAWKSFVGNDVKIYIESELIEVK